MGCRKCIFDVLPMGSMDRYFVSLLLLSLQAGCSLLEFETCLDSLPLLPILI